MSIRLMTAVWAMDIPATDKMVLLALADSANDDGVCWIALKSRTEGGKDLTVKCSLSKRAIQLAIGRLCESGLLKRVERPGKGVVYTVMAGGASDAPVHDVRPAPDAPAGAPRAPKPSIPVKTEAKASSDGVAEVVSAYKQMAKKSGLPDSRVQDASLRQKIRLRVKELGLDMVLEAIGIVAASPFLRGEGRKTNWNLTLDWLMTPANLRKVLDGAYGGTPEAASTPAEKIQTYEDRAAWFMGHNNEDEARRLMALAAQLRAAAAQDNDRRFKPVSAGSAALRIVGGLGTQ